MRSQSSSVIFSFHIVSYLTLLFLFLTAFNKYTMFIYRCCICCKPSLLNEEKILCQAQNKNKNIRIQVILIRRKTITALSKAYYIDRSTICDLLSNSEQIEQVIKTLLFSFKINFFFFFMENIDFL